MNKKGFTLIEIIVVVVIIGLLVAMALSAFNQVREAAREKAIINNLRQITAVGQQYLLEHGVESVRYTDLAGSSLGTITIVNGESYDDLIIYTDGSVLVVTDALGKTVTYAY